ncbi:Homeobox-leucine zipper protein [Sarracenia purpurea var. burkii]
MELALSLGEKPKPLPFLDKTQNLTTTGKHLGLFCMGLGAPLIINGGSKEEGRREEKTGSSDPPVQLDLLPFSPVQRNQQPPPSQSPSQLTRFPWLTANLLSEPGSSDGARRGLDVNRRPPLGVEEGGEDGAALSSPNSAVSSFQMDFDFSMYRSGRGKRDAEASSNEVDADQRGGCSRASDEEENGLNRKKLRLSKQQSAFLEESFKEHHTLNPKSKVSKCASGGFGGTDLGAGVIAGVGEKNVSRRRSSLRRRSPNSTVELFNDKTSVQRRRGFGCGAGFDFGEEETGGERDVEEIAQ